MREGLKAMRVNQPACGHQPFLDLKAMAIESAGLRTQVIFWHMKFGHQSDGNAIENASGKSAKSGQGWLRVARSAQAWPRVVFRILPSDLGEGGWGYSGA